MKLSKYIFIALGLLLCNAPSYAQNVHSTKVKTEHKEDIAIAAEESLLEKKIQEKIKLEQEIAVLEGKKKELLNHVKVAEKEVAEKTKENEGVNKKIKKMKGNEATKKYADLTQEKTQLGKSIETANNKIASLNGEISNLDSQLGIVNAERSSLSEVKEIVGKDLINKHSPYLSRTFSQMDLQELSSIKSECSKYSVDKNVNAFIKKVETTITQKHTFDASLGVLKNAYNSARINKAVADLQSLKCAPAQKQEISATVILLQKYEAGLKTFTEFINAYSRQRESISSDRDYNECVELILSKNNLKSRISTDISPIPYLKAKWDEYIASIKKDYKKVTSVETEILQQ